MTIMNALVTPERGIVGVNTEMHAIVGLNRQQLGLRGSAKHCSKLIPLGHVNAVLAARGPIPFLMILFPNCNCLGGDDFDTLIDNMPALLNKSTGELLQAARANGVTDDRQIYGQEAVLVGWSPSRDRVVGYAFVRRDRQTGFIKTEIDDRVLCPWEHSWGDYIEYTNADEMGKCAQDQCRGLKRLESIPGEGAAGGRFIVAEVTRDGMTIRTVCNL